MAKIYYKKLSSLISKLKIEEKLSKPIVIKHFFSGAALYLNETQCVTWSPVGLAFKLAEQDVEKLINNGDAIPLKYFPKGHIKKGYALFVKPEDKDPKFWKQYFKMAAENT